MPDAATPAGTEENRCVAELDELIAKAERLRNLAVECEFEDLATAIERELNDTRAWRDIVAEALSRASAAEGA